MFIIDDIINAIGASQASEAQQKSIRQAMDQQRDMWGQQRADQAPWMQAGQSSLADMMRMLQGGYDSSQMANDPGFQFRMQEGQKALERSAAARGGLNSGGTMKGLARYSQGLASEEFGNRFNRLAGVAGMGQGSAQNLGALGGQFANSLSNLFGAQGNAQSAGIMGVTNGISGGLQSLGGFAMGMPGIQKAFGFGGQGGGGLGNLIPQQSQGPRLSATTPAYGGGW